LKAATQQTFFPLQNFMIVPKYQCSNPLVYEQQVDGFSLIKDAQITTNTCFSICKLISLISSSFLSQNICSQCLCSAVAGPHTSSNVQNIIFSLSGLHRSSSIAPFSWICKLFCESHFSQY